MRRRVLHVRNFTGSYLSYDGQHLHLSQWYKKLILRLDERGNILREIDVGAEICGHTFVDGMIYVLRGEETTGGKMADRAARPGRGNTAGRRPRAHAFCESLARAQCGDLLVKPSRRERDHLLHLAVMLAERARGILHEWVQSETSAQALLRGGGFDASLRATTRRGCGSMGSSRAAARHGLTSAIRTRSRVRTEGHPFVGVQWLRENGWSEEVCRAILSHADYCRRRARDAA